MKPRISGGAISPIYTGPAAEKVGQKKSIVSQLGGVTHTQCKSLTKTNEESTGHEAGKIAVRWKRLHHSRTDCDKATDAHTGPTSQKVGLFSGQYMFRYAALLVGVLQ